MAAGIWERVDGARCIRRLEAKAWRVVEAQHVIATRKLVDSDEEQRVLEDLLEESKPPLPKGRAERLHYLLTTPFRYPPLRHGSRFGGRHERGIWYGSESLRTAFAEVAYYRLLFLSGTAADMPTLMVELSAFVARIRTKKGVDLTRPPFAEFEPKLISKANYKITQRLGHGMREAWVEAFRFRSARDTNGGTNVGVFDPVAFASTRPSALQTWLCVADRECVELTEKGFFERRCYRFPSVQFQVRGKLPAAAT
jgi:hypothetical protein